MKWTDFLRSMAGNDTKTETKKDVQPMVKEWKFTFCEDGKEVKAEGIAELEQYGEGYSVGDGIACFCGRGSDKTMILANTKTGKVRRILSANGDVLVSDSEIDYETVNAKLEYPEDVKYKCSDYHFGFGDWFDKGYASLSWTTHPDGMYYMDEDGFGMESDSEENVYCIINTNLEIVVPFKPMNTSAILEKLRMGEKLS